MNAAFYTDLLKSLRGMEKHLAAAYARTARADDRVRGQVSARWTAAEVGGRLDDYIDLSARRSAVRFLLRTVYVRVLEDLGALHPLRIRGDAGLVFFREVAPGLGIRSYLRFLFRDLAKDFPALFAPSDDELPLPDEDDCKRVWDLWHEKVGDAPRFAWVGDEAFDSRFLGDLYQELDAEVKKRFALLQTPHFVERYILDKTLTPALVEFDPEMLRKAGETFRVLDPTCGSGHFLIGAWKRLALWWEARGLSRWEAASRALDAVWGADINAHAVDIARFRLLLEVVVWTGERDLTKLRTLPFHLEVMDSLIPWERGAHAVKQGELFPGKDLLANYGTAEERERNSKFLDHAFHVVVGNPPYITPKDVKKRDDYRKFWPNSCHKQYALSVPFAERLFALGATSAFVGQITANTFMKRSFGRPLIENVLPTLDLTLVVDASGAFIPGHGIPTVILFGRNRRPALGKVLAILGKRGEPGRPPNPETGMVWTSIAQASEGPADNNPYISVAALDREVLGRFPWSLGGGWAPDIKERLEKASELDSLRNSLLIGNTTQLKADELYFDSPPSMRRDTECPKIALVEGDCVRDFSIVDARFVPYPYAHGTKRALELPKTSASLKNFWRYRAQMYARPGVGFKTVRERGQRYYEYPIYSPNVVTGMGIAFAFVSTHNHFVLERGDKIFNRSAPAIKLPANATEDDHLDLLGALNSSALGFWMKQVFHDKGNRGTGGGITAEDWERFAEYDATKLQLAPLTSRDRPARVALARALDATATERADCLPGAIMSSGEWSPATLAGRLATARARYRDLTEQMVALQEELDWLTYGSFDLIEPVDCIGPDVIEPLAPGHRPAEILAARADDDASDDEKSKWWDRHRHDRVTAVPARYKGPQRAHLEARIAAIEADPRFQLLESFAYKRRWQTPDLLAEARAAANNWLLDRLEDLFAEGGALAKPRPYRLEAIVAALQADARVPAVAAVATGSPSFELPRLVEALLKSHALPDHPWRVYTEEGMRTRAAWLATWALQDHEDAGEKVEVPLPPKYAKSDFQRPEFFQTRGKLDVPRERFVAFADVGAPAWGWNGWRDLARATAQVEALEQVRHEPVHPLPRPSHNDPRRCGATLGLWASLDDVRRWVGSDEHEELRAFAQEACGQTSCPCPLVTRWQEWARKPSDFKRPDAPASTISEVTIEEEAAVLQRLVLGSLSFNELAGWYSGTPERLAVIIDGLVGRGQLIVNGKGARTRYAKA